MTFRFRLDSLAKLDGFVAACLFDGDSGMLLGVLPNDRAAALERAASSWTAMLQAQRRASEALGAPQSEQREATGIDELVIRSANHLHLLRPLVAHQGLCFALVLDRREAEGEAKLALARLELANLEKAVL
ncbi:hypothetical protein ACNOYE_17175 [Nannocystaceae bacterium ST9]